MAASVSQRRPPSLMTPSRAPASDVAWPAENETTGGRGPRSAASARRSASWRRLHNPGEVPSRSVWLPDEERPRW